MFKGNEELSASSFAERRSQIENEYNAGSITADQRDELLGREDNARGWIRAKYAALAFICLTLGVLLLS